MQQVVSYTIFLFKQFIISRLVTGQKLLNIVQNIDFGSTAAAFSEGQADYTVEFEPGATSCLLYTSRCV